MVTALLIGLAGRLATVSARATLTTGGITDVTRVAVVVGGAGRVRLALVRDQAAGLVLSATPAHATAAIVSAVTWRTVGDALTGDTAADKPDIAGAPVGAVCVDAGRLGAARRVLLRSALVDVGAEIILATDLPVITSAELSATIREPTGP